MKKLKYLLSLAVGMFLLISCGGNKESDEHKDVVDSPAVTPPPKDTTRITVNEETKFKFDFALANVPSPVGSINELSSWGVEYNNALLNDTKNSEKYTTEFSKAINLGIYNIDMSYGMVNNKGQDVLKYMKTVMMQSDALGLKGAVDQMVGKRAEQNMDNKDSLLKILDEIFVRSDVYLRTNERVYTASNVFTGSWVESLYLTCKIASNLTNDETKTKARKHLWDQRFYLKNLTDLLNEYKDKKECVELNDELKKIHGEIEAIKDPKDMNDAKFKSISDKIFALRAKLVK